MMTSDSITEIAAAGAKAQLELQPAVKDAVNPAFRSKYADYASIREASRVYAKHGIAAWQDVTLTDAGVAVVTRLTHLSGQWMEFGPLTVPLSKRDAHGVGSATTYAKRYALSAALGIASDDDDGNGAVIPRAPGRTATAPDEDEDPAPAAPPGFAKWVTDLATVAEQGLAPLEAFWKASPLATRAFLTRTNPRSWDALKARAAAVKAPVGAAK